MKEIINKINGDIFSIMLPGLYLLLVFITIVLSNKNFHNLYTWNNLLELCKNWNNYWPLYLLAFFLSYLLGQVFRAIPVKNAEKICKKLFYWTTTEGSLDRIYYTTKFPYRRAMLRIISNLHDNGFPKNIFSLPDKKLHTAFNYFKVTLCAESTNLFIYTQMLEARVRLFSGIFWAGSISVILFILLGCYATIDFENIFWSYFHTYFLITSILITILIGMQLPRVRGQEVEYVFLSYLTYLVNKKPNKLISQEKLYLELSSK